MTITDSVEPASAHAPSPELTPGRAAWWAGRAYATLFVLAILANFAVRGQMIDLDDASATVADIASSESVFRLAMFAFLIVFVLDVAVSWLLHIVFRPYGERRSLLTAWLRLTYTVFLGVALVFMFVALRLIDAGGFAGTIDEPAREAHALLALDAFNATWMVGLTLFALHLVAIARILWTSRLAPLWMATGLLVAGLAYLVDGIGYTLLSDYDQHQEIFTAIVVLPAVFAEGSLTIWLLRRGWADRTVAADLRPQTPQSLTRPAPQPA